MASPKPNPAIRWLCLYGLGSLTAYSLIPYKTPWCIINILWPFFFVIGHLGETLAGLADRRLVYFVCGLLGWTPLVDTWRLNFRRPTKDGNRYVYVQTTFDIDKLLHPVRELIRANPLHRQMRGTVMIDAFPLIWELNDLPNIIYLDPGGVIGNFEADFLLVPDEREQEVDEHLPGIYFKERFRLRAGAADAWLYLNAERFQPVLPNRTPEFRPRVRQADPFHKPAGDMP